MVGMAMASPSLAAPAVVDAITDGIDDHGDHQDHQRDHEDHRHDGDEHFRKGHGPPFDDDRDHCGTPESTRYRMDPSCACYGSSKGMNARPRIRIAPHPVLPGSSIGPRPPTPGEETRRAERPRDQISWAIQEDRYLWETSDPPMLFPRSSLGKDGLVRCLTWSSSLSRIST